MESHCAGDEVRQASQLLCWEMTATAAKTSAYESVGTCNGWVDGLEAPKTKETVIILDSTKDRTLRWRGRTKGVQVGDFRI